MAYSFKRHIKASGKALWSVGHAVPFLGTALTIGEALWDVGKETFTEPDDDDDYYEDDD